MARFCTNCGNEIAEGVAFCTECGAKAPEVNPAPQQEVPVAETATPQYTEPTPQPQYAEPAPQPEPQAAPQPQTQYAPPPPPQYNQPQYNQQQYNQQQYAQSANNQTAPVDNNKNGVVGTAYYFFMQLLFSIPLIGLIVCIITACSGDNQSKKNFSKAYLIWVIIGIILSIVGIIAMIAVGASIIDYIASQMGGEFGSIEGLNELLEQLN